MYTTVPERPPDVVARDAGDTFLSRTRRWLRLCRCLVLVCRPGQWPKNLLVVSVPLADLDRWTLAAVGRTALAILAFTVAATVVYVLNDIADHERDRSHPTKRLRGIASGAVPVRVAAGFGAAALALLVGVMCTQEPVWSLPIVGYLLLSVAYSLKLKHLPILDVFAVSAGFALRVLQGFLATKGTVSIWLLTSVFALCLALILGKRRHELVAFGAAHRPALQGYTVGLTDRLMTVSAVLTAVAYLLYLRTEAPLGSLAPAATLGGVPFALFGLFRYMQVVEVHQGGENPVRILLRDRAMVVNSVLWLAQATAFLVVAHLDGASGLAVTAVS